MKHYILFTQEELEDMLNGCEIMHWPEAPYRQAHIFHV